MTTADPVIDWEAKFHQQVSDNIRFKATAREKLATAQSELAQANALISKLENRVRILTPAGDKLAEARAALEEAATRHINRVRELKDEIKALKDLHARGQRAVIEGVIARLQETADKLPAGGSEQPSVMKILNAVQSELGPYQVPATLAPITPEEFGRKVRERADQLVREASSPHTAADLD